ncbi:SelB C-terminal domain-containing protein [Nonomuraea diastatica]|uniref:Selenocysteine-specific translation elongation factor n=1 Tax=Nonomuraea diastatica TaxID=1848329 RepID=A0A4R4WZG4_9ACTN|nr:SelB C-terminal domain-containing protein [Nonomuraea diastatica]TDD23240.1 selenocysteine-specific translation elongation factor [Nonomuraea diastatica]
MHVVATAGHVDHGKSTLVRALTGMEPDRLDEERRRGLTIELGYAWTALPSGERLAFVDVPGHERFLGTMLAGVGPVPAVMVVVAADEGWMPQSEEHLVALEALGVRHCLLVVTRSDLADPAPVVAQALARLDTAGLGEVEAVAVSGRTGQGLPELRQALDRLVTGLPRPDPAAAVRLWIDRAFSVTGSGTVITGTLPAGTVSVGDELLLAGEPVRVRGLESLKEPRDTVTGVARVAVNLRGHDVPGRGHALVTPGGWTYTDLVDVRVAHVGGPRREAAGLPRRLTVHVGSAAVAAEARPLGGRVVRLRLARPVPLHLGDVLLLRDPGRARSEARVLAGASVLDVRPPALGRRGAARRRAAQLESARLESALLEPAAPGTAYALRLHRLLRAADLRAMGVEPDTPGTSGEWYADPGHWKDLGRRLVEAVRHYAAGHPLDPAMPIEAARHELGLPDRRLVATLVRPPLTLAGGRIAAGPGGLPEPVARAVERLRRDLAARPFHAPDAGRLAELGLGPRELAAAERAGSLLRVGEGVALLPGADARAAELLSRLPQPFTVSQARHALGTTRRVVVPLLEHLDRAGLTERVDEVHRRCR